MHGASTNTYSNNNKTIGGGGEGGVALKIPGVTTCLSHPISSKAIQYMFGWTASLPTPSFSTLHAESRNTEKLAPTSYSTPSKDGQTFGGDQKSNAIFLFIGQY